MIAPVRGISPALASLWALAITAVSVGAEATIEMAAFVQGDRAGAAVP